MSTENPELWEILEACRIYDLAQSLETSMPVSPNHPGFKMALIRRHGDMERADGSSASNEMMLLGGHTGTHIDALCHVSHRGQLFGGIEAAKAQKGGRFSELGVETIPPVLCRGVLLDIPRLKGVEVLSPEEPITAIDLQAAAQRQQIEIRPGDAVLVRSGWPEFWQDREVFLGARDGAPGPNAEAAKWLAEQQISLTGAHGAFGGGRYLYYRDDESYGAGPRRSLGVPLRADTPQGSGSYRSSGSPRGGGEMSQTPLQEMATFAANLSYRDLPDEVTSSLRERMLDIVGICLAARPLETSAMALTVARSWRSRGEASTIGFDHSMAAPASAFVNGVMAHSLDFDDTHLPSVLHPSASIVPAVLAVAEESGASKYQALSAAAAGYEVCIRTGMAGYDRELGNSVFFERGWHATSICGALAAATAAAKLLGLDAAGIGHAIGIAASMGSGIIEANRSGGSVKRLHCGWAAHSGVIAAQCAAEGITGPPTTFEGRFGFYEAFCGGSFKVKELTDGLGESWSIPGVFYKPYPSNHFTHAGIDAALKLRQRIGVEEIAEIELAVSTPTVRTIGEPREQKIRPESGYHAQFSGPFTVAAALLGGGGLGLWLDDFSDEKASDPRYLELAARVSCIGDPECDAIFPHQFPAILRIKTRDGRILEEKVLANRGGPGNPLSVDELKTKFLANAGRTLTADVSKSLSAALLDPSDGPATELLSYSQVSDSNIPKEAVRR
jgi:2-methylcitrate dehydratase PrpD/kynurenine formamidase